MQFSSDWQWIKGFIKNYAIVTEKVIAFSFAGQTSFYDAEIIAVWKVIPLL